MAQSPQKPAEKVRVQDLSIKRMLILGVVVGGLIGVVGTILLHLIGVSGNVTTILTGAACGLTAAYSISKGWLSK
jgi:hypothetical protein